MVIVVPSTKCRSVMLRVQSLHDEIAYCSDGTLSVSSTSAANMLPDNVAYSQLEPAMAYSQLDDGEVHKWQSNMALLLAIFHHNTFKAVQPLHRSRNAKPPHAVVLRQPARARHAPWVRVVVCHTRFQVSSPSISSLYSSVGREGIVPVPALAEAQFSSPQ